MMFISITTLDDELCGAMEPRTSRPARRLEALQRIASAGVPCGVMVAPVVPGLTDHEMPAILQAAATAGATRAAYTTLRLPGAVADIFETWLQSRSPARRAKVMACMRSLRSGHRNDSRFGVRMQGEGPFAKQISAIFSTACRRRRVEPDTAVPLDDIISTLWPAAATAIAIALGMLGTVQPGRATMHNGRIQLAGP